MSQTTDIEKHLKSGKTLTAIQALNKFNCFRLASRIDELRKQGMAIQTEMIRRDGKRYARYQCKQ